ncbi:carboxypeptidase O-like [Engraulis encrasicolus]|uniref:carboxypeptidase O-like n=1 Tax=Engraulis encrasicolus TaxID=184585 RepID=UPI002FCEC643
MEFLPILVLVLVQFGYKAVAGRVRSVREFEPINYDYTKYHPLPEIMAWMKQMVTENPGVVSSEVYGTSYEDRDIALLKIGLKGENKKAIWMDCGIHAREWIAPAFCQYFIKEVLRTYKTDTKVEQMLKNLDLYVTPVLNVDGYTYTWTNATAEARMWRKNRSPGIEGCNCTGVDLNRNYHAVSWGTTGVSSDCTSEVYPGPNATSEAETRAVVDYVQARSKDIICFLTMHSYSQLILFPYGNINIKAQNHDELTEIANAAATAIRAVHGMDYEVGTQAKVVYPTSGTSMDWAHLMGIPYCFTFELRPDPDSEHHFLLPENEIQPACEEAYEGVRSILTYVHDKTFYNAAVSLTANIWTTLLAMWLAH